MLRPVPELSFQVVKFKKTSGIMTETDKHVRFFFSFFFLKVSHNSATDKTLPSYKARSSIQANKMSR
jgi:hypothetical protein